LGGFSSNGSSMCNTSCLYTVNYQKDEQKFTWIFDLRKLGEHNIEVISTSGRKYLINVCAPLDTPECGTTHVCESPTRGSGAAIDFGRRIAFLNSNEEGNFRIVAELGENCPTLNPLITGKRRKTEIQFLCDFSVGIGQPQLLDSGDPCSIAFEWRSTTACRACATEDYAPLSGECRNGFQNVTYVAHKDCYDAGDGPKAHLVPCKETRTISKWIIIGGASGFGALILIVVFFIVRNRTLHSKYNLLLDAHAQKLEDPDIDDILDSSDDDDDEL